MTGEGSRGLSSARRPYNPGVFKTASSSPQNFWSRLAAVLGFLAVVSALLAPASMLAEEVRSGKLGGICSAGASWSGADEGASNADPMAAHCELCTLAGLLLPPLPVVAMPCFVGHTLVQADLPTPRAADDPGLPFSRGPPAFL